tara:strand:- start:147 stop:1418 length:1272 start_codon:yes stop_codon:yes gene_type:complete
MTRLLALEEVDAKLRAAITNTLRVSDEATALPAATRSVESGAFKNIVMRISGTEPDLSPELFSSNWWGGVSAVQVPEEVAEPLMRDRHRRARVLRDLRDKIASEMADTDLTVGPELEADGTDVDKKQWICGFDGPACSVGLYSALQSAPPEAGLTGMNRSRKTYYLVCKAGGGLAAQTFHARLTAALKKGKSLDEALESGSEPGPQALRRVAAAGTRNRKRILVQAAELLGFHTIDTLGDQASPTSERGAITCIDVNFNTLRKIPGGRSVWLYNAGCVDASMSTGLILPSNAAEGWVAFTTPGGEFKVSVRNEAANTIPFATPRLAETREIATRAAEAHRRGAGHPDEEFVREHFSWKSKHFGQTVDVEPECLWGSHASESFLAAWGRELGVASLKTVRLQPEAVCVSALEPAKLRAAARSLK